MPTEKSFSDRLGRGRLLQTTTAGFSVAFNPADVSLAATGFLAFLDALDALNTVTGAQVTQYTSEVEVRTLMVQDIKARTLRVLSYVESNVAWKKYVAGLKSLANKIRGNKSKKPKPPAPGETPGSPTAKARSKGEQSFAEIAENFEQLLAAVTAISGYSPAADITVASLTTLSSAFSAKNTTMGTLAGQVTVKQGERLAAYNGPGGLNDKMTAIKKAVLSQYGATSPEYAAVKGINL